jgi:hypothetical protein
VIKTKPISWSEAATTDQSVTSTSSTIINFTQIFMEPGSSGEELEACNP